LFFIRSVIFIDLASNLKRSFTPDEKISCR